MAAYLQRLLDTAAPTLAAPVELAPVIRSSSPVFEQDQLLALTDQAPSATSFGPTEPFDTASDVAALHRPETRRHGPSPVPLRQAPAPVATPISVTTGTEPIGKIAAEADPVPTREEASPPAPSMIVTEPIPLARPAAPSESNATDPPRVPTGRPASFAEPSERSDRPAAEVEVPATPESAARRPASPDDVRPGGEASLDPIRSAPEPSPSDPDRSPIELSPRLRPDLPPAANDAAPSAPAPPPAPAITIGHVTVEIVEERPATPPTTRPLTAATASVIGPLGQARTARRLIALRHL